MNLNKKSIAGIVTLAVAAVYGLIRLRSGDGDNEPVAVTEEQPAAAD